MIYNQFMRSILNRFPFFIRLFNWEYWPARVVYIPVMIYYAFLSVKARSPFYYSASNPSIETGGMFAESKWDVFQLIPPQLFPKTILVPANSDFERIKFLMGENGLEYPVIVKPDRGERGWMVKKIDREAQLKDYSAQVKGEFLIQKLVDFPVEMSLFYYRFPGEEHGRLSSVVIKEMLQVTGDGKSTVDQLIRRYPRALLQLKVLQKEIPELLNNVPAINEKIELVPIGNHARGAKFIDACYLIDEKLTAVMDNISRQIPGFYYGRYDIRCTSIEDLKTGRGWQILELNGAGAEPAHIYNPGFPLVKAYRTLFHHLRVMYVISKLNHSNGTKYMTLKEYLAMEKLEKNYKKKMENRK